MSVKVMGAVWDLKIERDQKFILLAYADHASHDGSSIYPAVSTVAEKTGYSERSVQMITRELEKAGYLIADGAGMHGTNRWRIPICGGVIIPEPRGADSAPVQELGDGGAENNQKGCKKTREGVQPTAPEPSLTILKPSKENMSQDQKNFESAAIQVFGNNITSWRGMQKYLQNAKYFRDDEQFRVTGCGMPAAMLQDRYARTFSNILAGIYNLPTEVVFMD